MKTSFIGKVSGYFLLISISIIIIFPVYYTLSTSLKTNADAQLFPPKLFDFEVTTENIRYLFDNEEFYAAVRISFLVAIFTTLLVVLAATPLAYSLSRMNYPGKKLIVLLVTLVQVTPAIVLLVPLFALVSKFGLYDKVITQVLILSALILPFATWILVAFVKSIPYELEEAAFVDGASRLQVIWHIIRPLLTPGIVTVAIFTLIGAWNEFLVPVIMSESNAKPVTVFITRFITEKNIDYGLLAAACSFLFVPVLLFTIFAKRFIVGGLLAGSVKG
jgi:ABC-type glycerol-3-phosphate transport system permease component